MFLQFIIMGILLLLSGLFSSSETALFSISSAKARHLAKGKRKADLLIERMKKNPHNLLSTILIGNNVVNVGSAALATTIAMQYFPGHAVGLATGIMTILILIFGEVLPKSFATQNNVLIARMVIYPIYWLSILFYPLLVFLAFIPRLIGNKTSGGHVSEAELLTYVEIVEEQGEIKQEEMDMIHRVVNLDDTSALQIMTPRTEMYVIDVNNPPEIAEIARSGFTRVPVIDGGIDNCIGIINLKDLIAHGNGCNVAPDFREIMREPYFIPGSSKLDKLLKQFKKRRFHLAIVVDEFGGVAGLISLEDVIEELVGEIEDESDREEVRILKMKKEEWLVLGKTEIREINARIPIRIPEDGNFETFSGYVHELLGSIPKEGEEIELDRCVLKIKKMKGARIEEIVVKMIP